MSIEAVEYVKTNMPRYSREALYEALKKAGYSEREAKESLAAAYGDPLPLETPIRKATGFWDIRGRRINLTRREKLKDLLLGLALPAFFLLFLKIMPIGWFLLLFIIFEVGLSVFFIKRRRYTFIGLILGPVLGAVIIGTYVYNILSKTGSTLW